MKQRKGEAKIFTIATIQNKYHYFYETKCAVSMKALNFTQIKSCKSIRQHFVDKNDLYLDLDIFSALLVTQRPKRVVNK